MIAQWRCLFSTKEGQQNGWAMVVCMQCGHVCHGPAHVFIIHMQHPAYMMQSKLLIFTSLTTSTRHMTLNHVLCLCHMHKKTEVLLEVLRHQQLPPQGGH